MMNYRVILCAMLCGITLSMMADVPEECGPILEHPVLKIIDGTTIGIDGQTIGFMLKVRREIINLLTHVSYVYKNTMRTIPELRVLEADLELQRLYIPCQQYMEERAYLDSILQVARDHFLQTVKPFMEQAHGAKKQMVLLIGEWSEKRDRLDSQMLNWARVPEEKEMEEFHRIGNTFAIFDDFCHDLISFLQDLIRSCPKGLAQFKKLLADKKLEHIMT